MLDDFGDPEEVAFGRRVSLNGRLSQLLPIDRASRVRLDGKPMKTSAQYLAMSQRYRIAKLSTRDAAARDQLEILERSYFILSRSAQILLRSKVFRMRFSTPTTRCTSRPVWGIITDVHSKSLCGFPGPAG